MADVAISAQLTGLEAVRGSLDAIEREILDVSRAAQTGAGGFRQLEVATSGVNQSLVAMRERANAAALALKAIVVIAALDALRDLSRVTVGAAVSFQSLRQALVTTTGSAEAAARAFNMLREFAAETPFSLENLVRSFNILSAAGLQPSEEQLRKFGDTAAAFNRDIVQMAEAVADAATGQFERLREFGITARSEADKVRFTFQGTTIEVEKRADQIVLALERIGEAFAGGMVRQSQTARGALSNLGDSVANFADTLAQRTGALEGFAAGIRAITSAVDALTRLIRGADVAEQLAALDKQISQLQGVVAGDPTTPRGRLAQQVAARRLKELEEQRQALMAQVEAQTKAADAAKQQAQAAKQVTEQQFRMLDPTLRRRQAEDESLRALERMRRSTAEVAKETQRTVEAAQEFSAGWDAAKTALEGVQSAFAGFFEDVLSDGTDRFAKLANSFKSLMISAMAQVAAAWLQQRFVMPLVAGSAGVTSLTAGVGGLGGVRCR